MYEPKKTEKKSNRPREQAQVGGVILDFAQSRKTEAEGKFREFIKGPINWMRENEPIRKALILEGLDIFRPLVEVSHEHEIQKWKKGVKKSGS